MKEENLGVVYFEQMKELSQKVHEKIRWYVENFEGIGNDLLLKKLQKEMMVLPNARAGKNIMRSMLTALMYKLNGGNGAFEDILLALVVSELNNINAYLDNIILDGKKGIWHGEGNREKISEITVVSGVFRELTERVILDMPISDVLKVKILTAFCRAMAKSYQGQQIDLETGIHQWADFVDDQSFCDWYTKKSELQSGFPYGFSAWLGAVLAEKSNKEQVKKSEEIGRLIGLGVHVSNDLGDFAPVIAKSTGFKYCQDQMADLVNGRLTFPIHHVLKNGTDEERERFLSIVGNSSLTEEELVKAAKIIHSSGAFTFGKKLLRGRYKELSSMIEKAFPDSSPEKGMLKSMTSVIISNKFLSALRDVR